MAIACACSDGRTGAQTCRADGTYAACECSGSRADGGGGPHGDDGGVGSLDIVRSAPGEDRVYTRETVTLQFVVHGSPERVEILVEGTVLAELLPPYTFVWDTRTHPEGEHEVVGRAVGGSAVVTTAPITVVVDRTPPRVVSHQPAPEDADVWLGAPIVLELSEALSPASVTESAVTIGAGDATGLPKTLRLSEDATRITLSLEAAPRLPAVMRVDTGAIATDLAGNPVIPHSFTFDAAVWARVGDTVEVPSTLQVTASSMSVNDAGASCAAWLPLAGTDLHVSCFDGSAWQQVGPVLNVDPTARALGARVRVDAVGNPVVAWTEEGDSMVVHVARWTGSAWALLDLGVTGLWASSVSLHLDSTDQPLVGMVLDRHLHVRRWTGAGWDHVGTDIAASGLGWPTVASTSTGDVLVGWSDYDGCQVRSWNGSEWEGLGASIGDCTGVFLTVDSDDVPLAAFHQGTSSTRVTRWSGSEWVLLGSSFSQARTASLRVDADDRPVLVYVDTSVSSFRGVNVQRYDARGWERIGHFPTHSSAGEVHFRRFPAVLLPGWMDVEAYRYNGL